MVKHLHEVRDPIHVFVRLNTDERKVVDSLPVQRLRHIHQLATTFLVYPGATHRRFEHSLGVMELAGRVFDVVTHPYNIHDDVRRIVPEITEHDYVERHPSWSFRTAPQFEAIPLAGADPNQELSPMGFDGPRKLAGLTWR